MAIDFIEWTFRQANGARWWKDWLLALVLGAAYCTIVFAVQWNFSTFLLSDAADNRFFARAGHWPYFSEPGDWMNSFWKEAADPVRISSIIRTFVTACVSSRVGLWLGNYLLRLRR